MDRFEVGMLARSKAGHDKGHVYIIMKEDNAYVYLVDGSLRTLDRPKKKKKIHVQIILQQHETSDIDDVAIKRILKLFDKETGRI